MVKSFSRIVLTLSGLSFSATAISPVQAQLPPVVDLRTGTAPLTILGATAGDLLGDRLDTVDMDGDGFPDCAVFASDASPLGRTSVGLLYVIRGRATFPGTIDLAVPGSATTIIPPTGADGFWSQLGHGDFNGDGYGDIVLTDPCGGPACNGRAFIVFGSPLLPASIDLAVVASGVTRIDGESGSNGFLGLGVAAGDVNGDDLDDLVIAAPVFQPTSRVYVVMGRPVFPATISLGAPDPTIVKIIDPEYGWGTGESLACGDVDLDGHADMLIGSPGDVAWTSHGKATLVYGAAVLPPVITLNDPSMRIARFYADSTQGGGFGVRVAIGDVTRDMYGDMIVSAFGASSPDYVDCGTVFMLPGGSQVPDSIDVNDPGVGLVRFFGGGNFRYTGRTVAAGDLTGEHFCDIAVADSPIGSDTSIVTVIYGSASFPDTVSLAEPTGTTRVLGYEGASFGWGLAMGDLNRDGFSEVLIGAPYANPLGRQYAGKVFVLMGTGTLSSATRPPLLSHLQSHPNPFSTSTTITYDTGGGSRGVATLYDVAGRTVREFNVKGPRGTIVWDGTSGSGTRLPSGVYFCRFETDRRVLTLKIMLLR